MDATLSLGLAIWRGLCPDAFNCAASGCSISVRGTMDIVTFFQAAFLGLVEGITEFLPVSSTGHLILLVDLLGFQGPPGAIFEIVIQLGAILAVVWVYRTKLINVLIGLPREASARRFTLNILLAFLPAMVIGALAYDLIKGVLFSPWVVSAMLIVGGVAIIIIERLQQPERYHSPEEIPPMKAIAIGLFQCTAMIPGVSRSAATIMGALLVGVERRAAAEFSFLLAIPTILAATAYDLYKNYENLTTDNLVVIGVGFVTAFIVAMLVVRGVLGFISRHGYVPFAVYRIIVGTIMLAILVLR